jgi:two-component sensor histidine kinase
LQGAANILGMAIEQQQYQRKLKTALDRHQILLKEVNHRVKNSLQVISSMLTLQASASGDPDLSAKLNDASGRISAVGRAYERLAYNADYENIDLIAYLKEVIHDLGTTVAPCTVDLDALRKLNSRRSELSNAGKYAYPDCPGGPIWVRVVRTDKNAILVSVRDEGAGLPTDFDPTKSKRLGTRLVSELSKQFNADMTRPTSAKGTYFALIVPIDLGTSRAD